MHLYYARIMQAILFHRSPGILPAYYYIKHLFPPYSLYYYLLLLFGKFVPLIAADKIVVCLYVLLFVSGFRFLARSTGPAYAVMALLSTVLILNWPLGMGFVNFCLSIAISLWAIGLWSRAVEAPEKGGRIASLMGFVVLSWAVMMTHPVPLLGVLGFCWLEFCIRLLRRGKTSANDTQYPEVDPSWLRFMLRELIALIAASATLLYVRSFTQRDVIQQAVVNTKSKFTPAASFKLLGLGTLVPFQGKGPVELLYRGCFLLILVFALVIGVNAILRSRRTRTWTLGNTWTVLSILLAVALPFLPPELNNSHLFSARLVIFIWIAALAGASGSQAVSLNPLYLRYATVFVILFAAFAFTLAIRRINPVARDIARSEQDQGSGPSVEMLLQSADYVSPANLTYDPYLWSGTRILRHEGSVMYNIPWLQLQIIPIGAMPDIPTGKLDSMSMENPWILRDTLHRSLAARTLVFSKVDRILINHGLAPTMNSQDPIFAEDPNPANHWHCQEMLTYSDCTDK